MPEDAAGALQEAFRGEWPRLVSAAARIVGELGRAEEIAQDVMVAALDRWPFTGVPDRPGAWLLTAARNRARNVVRDEARARDRTAAPSEVVAPEPLDGEDIGDDRLRLVFACCHPVLAKEARIALTLRMVGGLSTAEIARAFLVPTATMAQRLVRAKRALADAGLPFAIPDQEEWRERLSDVLTVIYLIFNEGYAAASGAELIRPVLCDEARRLAALLTELLPAEAEVCGLVGLVSLHAARLAGRVDDHGDLVLLPDQDRGGWDQGLIALGDQAIERALRLGPPGPLTLQAMIAVCHAGAPSWEATDWSAIIALYDELAEVSPSPVVALNRAVATSMISLDAAWADLASLADQLDRYPPFWAVRADVLRRSGRPADAAVEYRRAAALEVNEPEHRFLIGRAVECEDQTTEEVN